MPDATSSADRDERASEDRGSLGQLVAQVTADLQKLFRQEVELAKTEVRQEVAKAGKAAAMLGGAGFAGYMVAVLLSFAAAFALAEVMGLGWATLVLAAVWAVIGVVLFATGRSRLRGVSPVPQQTVETLKEDAQWVRHPTK